MNNIIQMINITILTVIVIVIVIVIMILILILIGFLFFSLILVFIQVLSALPYIWRFFQCLRKYYDSTWKDRKKRIKEGEVGEQEEEFKKGRRGKRHGKHEQNLWNAGKYFSAIIYVVFLNLHQNYDKTWTLVLAIVTGVFSYSYRLYWDLKVDWSLFEPRSEPILLRNKRLYRPTGWYCYYCCC